MIELHGRNLRRWERIREWVAWAMTADLGTDVYIDGLATLEHAVHSTEKLELAVLEPLVREYLLALTGNAITGVTLGPSKFLGGQAYELRIRMQRRRP